MRKIKKQKGGAITNTGYLPDSPDRFNDFNIIPSNIITMDNVNHDIIAIADNGQTKLMKKNSGLHKFIGATSVKEIPVKQSGGPIANEDYYGANATLSYYKDQLNNKLKASNPQGYNDYFKGLVGLRRSGDADGALNYVQNTPYDDYLSPQDVKATLGDDHYNRYLDSLKTVNAYNVKQGQQPLYGTEEGNKDINQLNYGRRFASMPITSTYTHTNKDTKANYSRAYSYSPEAGVTFKEAGDISLSPFMAKDKSLVSKKRGGMPKAEYGMGYVTPGLQSAQVQGFQPGYMSPAEKFDQNHPHGMDEKYAPPITTISPKQHQKNIWDFIKQYPGETANFGLGLLGNALSADKNTFRQDAKINGLTDSMYSASDNQYARGDYDANQGVYRADQQGYKQFADGGLPLIASNIDAQAQSSADFSGFGQAMIPNNPAPVMAPEKVQSTNVLKPSKKAEYAYQYYVNKGLPAHQAAGIVGNLVKESGLKTDAVEKGNTGNGRGIAQWDKRDRWLSMINWATQNKRDPMALDTQLDYVLEEPGEGKKVLKRLAATTTPTEAAHVFGRTYERPNENFADWNKRAGVAEGLFQKQYKLGGEYVATDEEIQHILKNGGQVEYL